MSGFPVGFYGISSAPALPGISIIPAAPGSIVGPAPTLAVASTANPGVVGVPFGLGVGVGLGAYGAGGSACGELPQVAAPLVGAQGYGPCWYFRERIAPPLYMLASEDCQFGKVCCETGKIYRSFATVNTLGANAFLQKGLASIGKGCGQTVALAPLVGSGRCHCLPPYA